MLDLPALETLAWKNHRAVLVLGEVSRAVWWPAAGGRPGVLVTGSIEQARAALRLERVPVGA